MIARLRPLSVICLAALLTACAGSRTPDLGELPPDTQGSAEQLLQQAGESKPEKALLRLAAADRALAAGNLVQARDILDGINLATTQPTQQVFASTLNAELALARQKPKTALQALQHPAFASLDQLPVSLQIRSRLAQASALQADGQLLPAAHERIRLAPSLREQAAIDNHERIWTLVSSLPQDSLSAPAGNDALAGWLQLASLTHGNATPAQQLSRLDQWLAANPLHPAAMQLPAPLVSLRELAARPLTHVGLLLPQQGPLAGAASALRDGFLAAHYQQQGSTLKISLYDSSRQGSLSDVYRQAQADGVQLLIGPLEKPLVSQLQKQSSLPITTLALNYADSAVSGPAQLFQYGLAAEDEAREVARQAWDDGKRRAVALVPRSDWGTRVAVAFRQAWEARGGQLIGVEYIDQPTTLSSQVAELMQLRSSEARIKQMRDVLKNENLEALVRRQDIDMVFLAATPAQARQVKPTLAFQYASDLPVYATSHLFNGDYDASRDHDLSGIRFCETPWMLQADTSLRKRITAQWPESGNALGRLYAMGADAYSLAPRLEQLRSMPDSRVDGLTGSLGLGNGQRISRQLPWAEYREGQLFLLPGRQ